MLPGELRQPNWSTTTQIEVYDLSVKQKGNGTCFKLKKNLHNANNILWDFFVGPKLGSKHLHSLWGRRQCIWAISLSCRR